MFRNDRYPVSMKCKNDGSQVAPSSVIPIRKPGNFSNTPS